SAERLRIKQVPDECQVLGKKIIFDGAIAAPGSSKANDVAPIVVESNVCGRKGGKYDDRLTAILFFRALDDCSAQNPFGMMDATVEPPATADPIPALLTHGATSRKEGNGGRRDVTAGENAVEASLRQEGTERSNCGGANHGAPGAGEVMVGDCLQHQHFGD